MGSGVKEISLAFDIGLLVGIAATAAL